MERCYLASTRECTADHRGYTVPPPAGVVHTSACDSSSDIFDHRLLSILEADRLIRNQSRVDHQLQRHYMPLASGELCPRGLSLKFVLTPLATVAGGNDAH